MPTLEALVDRYVALAARRDQALAALGGRAGVEVPPLESPAPRPLTGAVLDQLATDVLSLEFLQALAADVDALRAAAPRGAKGASR